MEGCGVEETHLLLLPRRVCFLRGPSGKLQRNSDFVRIGYANGAVIDLQRTLQPTTVHSFGSPFLTLAMSHLQQIGPSVIIADVGISQAIQNDPISVRIALLAK